MAKRIVRPEKSESGPPARRRPSEAAPLAGFRSELERLWERAFGEPARELFGAAAGWPSVDVIDEDGEVTVRAELPGVDPEDVRITVSGGVLTLSGEKRESHEETRERFMRSETRWGSFRRTFSLPPGADADRAEAEFDRGVLTVRIPKRQGESPKRIPVSRREPSAPS